MPARGKVGPRPGVLRGAFSSGRTSRLGRESDCGGRRGDEKVLPQGLEGARVSAADAAPLRGGSTAGAATEFSQPLAPTSYCGLSRREGSSGAFFLVPRTRAGSSGPRGRGRGCRVLAAAVGSWPPPRSGWCVVADPRGLSLPLPGEEGALRAASSPRRALRARGFSATRVRS